MFFSGGEVSPLHLVSNMLPKIKVMLVMAQERRLPLLDVLESCGIEVVPACNCNEARRMLETQSVQTVVTDRALPDGDWRAVLEIVAQDRANVQVVVCSRLGDHTLLIDVLEQGAYDVLVEPYQREEVRRVLEAAAARSDVRYRPLARMTGYKTKAARAAV
jgi:two-component system, chemotaxis family, chemotaxis protein CheY